MPFIFTQLIQFSGLAVGGSALDKLNIPYPAECLIFTAHMTYNSNQVVYEILENIDPLWRIEYLLGVFEFGHMIRD